MNGKYTIIGIIAILLILSMTTSITMAKKPIAPGKPVKQTTLYLFQKDPETWDIVEHGAWGKMKYTPVGTELQFNFQAHKLLPEQWYSLIYYPDPWPGYELIILAETMSDSDGNLQIKDSIDSGDLPRSFDDNYLDGAKIWLVLYEDISLRPRCMMNWNPTEYLFEDHLITFDDTDYYQRY
jgi:hypothetical protein